MTGRAFLIVASVAFVVAAPLAIAVVRRIVRIRSRWSNDLGVVPSRPDEGAWVGDGLSPR